jgi:murein DD-endopeptidase MepM/ murein hydrolase activator NlpD
MARGKLSARRLLVIGLCSVSAFALALINKEPAPPVPASDEDFNSVVKVAIPDDSNQYFLTESGALERLPFEPMVPKREAADEQSAADENWINVSVAPGDNLSLIFSRLKLSKTELHDIVSLGGSTASLKQLKPGQIVRFRVEDSAVQEMVVELDQLNSLRIARNAGGFVATTDVIEPEIKVAAASTAITHSLFLDGQKVGLSDAIIMRLTEIFGWDVDFALDLRENDHFSVIYEEVYKGDELVKQDRILAAEFVNQGKRLRAVLFTDPSGRSAYYSDKGEAMRKAFLRTPVNFTRISSRFDLRRKHPILNTIRAHRGVDYAAPSGTPVRAVADGKIRSIGTNGGYGRTVEMQHGDTYSTLYAHLSRFARGMKRGANVQQGQIIGYVGKSGLATGPHLHYEFRINGVHRNPLTVDLPKALPLEKRHLAAFQEQAAPLLSQLDILVAKLDTNPTYVAQLDTAKLLPRGSNGAAN